MNLHKLHTALKEIIRKGKAPKKEGQGKLGVFISTQGTLYQSKSMQKINQRRL